MNGQIDVRFITAITVALTILFSTIAINGIATKGPNEDIVATNLEALYQLARIADKYTGEALSYAYYLEISNVFDPSEYSNSDEEWMGDEHLFTYPHGTASCETIGGAIGCIIWNLTGGNEDTNPCPDTIENYDPDPNPINTFNNISIDNIKNYFVEALKDANEMIANNTTFGKNSSLEYSVELTANADETEMNAVGTVNVVIYDQIGDWTLNVNRIVTTDITLTAEMKHTEYIQDEAKCICEEADSGSPVTLKRYKMGEYYIEIKVINNNTGEVIVEGNIPYVKYFKEVVLGSFSDGTVYRNCRINTPG